MLAIIYTLTEIVYYIFISYIIAKFKNDYLANAAIILFAFSMLISIASLVFIYIIKNRKTYFLISNIVIITISLIIYIFRNYTKNGLLNFAFYLYSLLFMLIPFFSFFTVNIHKLYYNKKRKQLIQLIVFKKIIIIVITFILSFFMKFVNLITIISIMDCLLNLFSPIFSNFLIKYQD